MSFKDCQIKSVYRTGRDAILQSFLIPVIKNAISYDRAAGYFGSQALAETAEGLFSFVSREGKIRLIVGTPLSAEEESAISAASDLRSEMNSDEIQLRITRELLALLQQDLGELSNRRLDLLSYLIKNNNLEIKIAICPRGIFHEKIGVLKDENGDVVVFQGSANETRNGLCEGYNQESINVFKSWHDSNDHVEPHIQYFEMLWADQVRDILVKGMPEAIRQGLIERDTNNFDPSKVNEIGITLKARREAEQKKLEPRVPEGFELFPHQRRALEAWIRAGHRGILSMATGAGKTYTAIYLAVRALVSRERLVFVVAVPRRSLAEQWIGHLRKFNFDPVPCFTSVETWRSKLRLHINDFKAGIKSNLSIVVVDRTLAGVEFNREISSLRYSSDFGFLFVGDECHNHGAPAVARSLPEMADMRLGLSATSDRANDEEGTRRIKSYYGDEVYGYSLSDAIGDKVLCGYEYYADTVYLTESESEEYRAISRRIGEILGSNASEAEILGNEQARYLFFRRARLLGRASGKIEKLKRLLAEQKIEGKALIYCGEGRSEEDEESDDQGLKDELSAIDIVTKIVAMNGLKVSKFTSNESEKEQREILKAFQSGELKVLTAMRCLDEGIDVPDTQTAVILASTRNPRQYVQRRGRVLRKAPNKDRAVIYDFVVSLLPQELGIGDNQLEKNLLRAELQRVKEFSMSSLNPSSALAGIRELGDLYGVPI